MFFINLIIILIYIMLAILSRKNYSKYKGKKGMYNLFGIFLAIGDIVYNISKGFLKDEDTKKILRKCNVVSPKKLEDIERQYVVKGIALALVVFFIFNIISGIVSLPNLLSEEESSNVILRDDYGGDEEEYEISLEKDGNIYDYNLSVAPLEYSVEDVCRKSEEVFAWLNEAILGNNESLYNVSSDLQLPLIDEENIFEIAWDSDNPMLVTSEGKVIKENVKNGDVVTLRAELTYMDFVFEEKYTIRLEVVSDEYSDVAMVQKILTEMELGSRTIRELELPENIQGIQVSIKQKSKNQIDKTMILGVILCVCIFVLRRERLKDAGRKRDNMLLRNYPVFVNKLYLLLWTGMTIKNALIHYVTKAQNDNLLVEEIEYTLNQIKSGVDEVLAYEELGQRLQLVEYGRLMNQISHNLKRGNYDLLECMEEEIISLRANRKENARRLGEEASTKLLLPMILLLAVVMVIVIIPAITEF